MRRRMTTSPQTTATAETDQPGVVGEARRSACRVVGRLDLKVHRAGDALEVFGADLEQPTPEENAPPAPIADELQGIEQWAMGVS